MDRGIRSKMIAVGVLLLLVVSCLVYAAFFMKSEPKPVPTPTPTPTVEVTPTPTPTPTPVPTEEIPPEPVLDLESVDSINKIVNVDHQIEADYVPSDLVEVNVDKIGESQQLRQEAATALEEMFEAAQADGIYMRLVSGYRSYEEQTGLFNTYVNQWGLNYASRFDDHPGYSEHQLGLAADIGNYNNTCTLQFCFDEYASSVWLVNNAHNYGYIQRYPLAKEQITHIIYSPWHYRYVGVEEATKIHDSGLTVEEYYNY